MGGTGGASVETVVGFAPKVTVLSLGFAVDGGGARLGESRTIVDHVDGCGGDGLVEGDCGCLICWSRASKREVRTSKMWWFMVSASFWREVRVSILRSSFSKR